MQDRIDMLEKTILDLGAEVYRLRHVMVSMTLRQQAMSKLMDGLKSMLDEKGLISTEEVEEAALMRDLVDPSKMMAIDLDEEQDRLVNKKDINH